MGFSTGHTYLIKNKHSGLFLNVAGYSKDSSAMVEQYPLQSGEHRDSQTWYIIPIEDDQFLIKNKHSGCYLNVNSNSTAPSSRVEQCVMQHSKVHPAQKWLIHKDHHSGHYTIQNQKSNLYLNVAAYSNANSAHAEIYHLHDGEHRASQVWEIESVD